MEHYRVLPIANDLLLEIARRRVDSLDATPKSLNHVPEQYSLVPLVHQLNVCRVEIAMLRFPRSGDGATTDEQIVAGLYVPMLASGSHPE